MFFTLENGLALYHYGGDLRKEKEDTRLQLKSVQTSDAELKDIIYLTLSNSLPPTTSYKRNNLVFTVFYPNYSQLNNLNFRYKMEGLDKVWSEPVGASQVTYNYMPYGKYNLQVEVLSKSGFKLDEISYRFEVRPPFYLSNTAK